MLKISFWCIEPSTERAQLKLDATAVYTALGLNEKLFICTSSQVEQLVRMGMPSIHVCFLAQWKHKCHHFRHIYFGACSWVWFKAQKAINICSFIFFLDAPEGAAGSRASNNWYPWTDELQRHRQWTHQLWLGAVHCHAWGNSADMTHFTSNHGL